MSDLIIDVSDIDFKEKVLDSRVPVFVDFWAPWCGPCQSMGPIIAAVALQFEGRMIFAKCNIDDFPLMAEKYGIDTIPTILIFKNGTPAATIAGTAPRRTVAEILQTVLDGKPSDNAPQ